MKGTSLSPLSRVSDMWLMSACDATRIAPVEFSSCITLPRISSTCPSPKDRTSVGMSDRVAAAILCAKMR